MIADFAVLWLVAALWWKPLHRLTTGRSITKRVHMAYTVNGGRDVAIERFKYVWEGLGELLFWPLFALAAWRGRQK